MFPGGSRHEIKTDQKMEKQQWMWFRYDTIFMTIILMKAQNSLALPVSRAKL